MKDTEGIDVKIEHMIVDATTLDVKPIADRLLAEARGEGPGPERVATGQVDRGLVTWSNHLGLHVIGLKTTAPAPDFVGLATHFQESVGEIDGILRRNGRPPHAQWHAPLDGSRAGAELVALREQRRLPGLRSHIWVSGTRLGQPAEHATEPTFSGGRRVRASSRRCTPHAPAHPRVGGRVTGDRRASGARPRQRVACVPREREPHPFCRRRGGARAGGLAGRVPGGHSGAHLRRPRGSRSRGTAPPRMGEWAGCRRPLRAGLDRDPRDRLPGVRAR